MNDLLNRIPVIAERAARLDDLTSQFRERRLAMDSGTVVGFVALLAGIVIAFCLLARLLERHEWRTNRSRPWRLLVSLSRAHGLRWPEIWFLWRLAVYQKLQDPARLFLEPERMMPQAAGPVLSRRADLLESLRKRLFAGLNTDSSLPR